jgi:hypothetical protein
MAPRCSDELALLYERERQRGNGNRAILAVARRRIPKMNAGFTGFDSIKLEAEVLGYFGAALVLLAVIVGIIVFIRDKFDWK